MLKSSLRYSMMAPLGEDEEDDLCIMRAHAEPEPTFKKESKVSQMMENLSKRHKETKLPAIKTAQMESV
jgi:hypothetical protein